MVVRALDGTEPDVDDAGYVDETAVVIGDVTVGPDASVWPNATLRGDVDPIVVREGANVQDNAVCHEAATVGPYATVGHGAIVHAATVGRRATVGMGAVLLDGAVVGERSLVAAGSVVTEGTEIPPETLAAGTPAELIEEAPDPRWTEAGDRYVERARRHREGSERIDQDGTE